MFGPTLTNRQTQIFGPTSFRTLTPPHANYERALVQALWRVGADEFTTFLQARVICIIELLGSVPARQHFPVFTSKKTFLPCNLPIFLAVPREDNPWGGGGALYID
jgi:hypothetical protein